MWQIFAPGIAVLAMTVIPTAIALWIGMRKA